MDKKTYLVLSPVFGDRKYLPGESIELEAHYAERLQKIGVLGEEVIGEASLEERFAEGMGQDVFPVGHEAQEAPKPKRKR